MKVDLSNLTNLENEVSAVSKMNVNNDAIEIAMENTLSRDGTGPNQMGAQLDMNSNRILNLPAASSPTEPVRKAEFDALATTGLPVFPTGFVSQVGGGIFGRTFSGTPAEINVSFGDGSGNPVISLPTAITLTGKTLTNGTFVNPDVTTQSPGNNTTKAASTAFVTAAVLAGVGGTGLLLLKANNLNDVADVAASRVNLGVYPAVADRTALKALDTTKTTLAYLKEAGREGLFQWIAGDFTTLAAADALSGAVGEGVYIKANAIATSVGIWYRAEAVCGKHSVKWYGAAGNNAGDDQPAIQKCITAITPLAGATVYFPIGGYRIGSSIAVNLALTKLEGAGQKRSNIYASSGGFDLFVVTAPRICMEGLSIFNQNGIGTTTGVLIKTTTGATQCTFRDLDMVGGYYCMSFLGSTANNLISNCVGRETYGGAIIYTQTSIGLTSTAVLGGALIFENCVFDQDWPVGTPRVNGDPLGTQNKGARSATAYAVGDFVTYNGLMLQCRVAGTASGTPSLTGFDYHVDLTDGTVKWRLANIAESQAVLVDTGSTYVTFKDTDMTGAFKYAAQVSNTLGGTFETYPNVIRFINITVAGVVNANLQFNTAKSVWAQDCELQAPVGSNTVSVGIYLPASFTGDAQIKGNLITGQYAGGISVQNTSFGSANIVDNEVFGSVYGIYVAANVKQFKIIGNSCGVSSIFGANQNGIFIAAGSGDYFSAFGNSVNGCTTSTFTNNATGTHVYVPNGSNY